MKNKNSKLNNPIWHTMNGIGIVALGTLVIMGYLLLSPSLSTSVSASPLTATAGVAITANSMATVAISVDDQVNIDIKPTSSSNGDFKSGVSRLHVSTNNTSGYSLYMTTVNESGNLDPIVGGVVDSSDSNDGSNKAIVSLTADTLGSNFTGNTWGYNLSKVSGTSSQAVSESGDSSESGDKDGGSSSENATSLTYSAVPTSASQAIYTTDSANLEIVDNYNLTFGVNIDSTLPAGTYTNSVLVSAVANPITISELSQLTYMQDMTSSICEHTVEHATKQLVDTRDGKKYWVAKLKDGNCWMTQNLALNLGTAPDAETEAKLGKFVSKLTPEDSNVESDWIPESSTRVDNTNNTSTNSNGTYKLSPMLTGTLMPDNYVSQYSWGMWQNVAVVNQNAMAGCHGITSDRNLADECNSGFEQVNMTSDRHNLVGVYYSWNAATANTGVSLTSGSAKGSICPKGWVLPRAGSSSFSQSGSFAFLLRQYGLLTSDVEFITLSDDELQSMIDWPLYFVRSGIINLESGALNNATSTGYYWSPVLKTAYRSYLMVFNDATLRPSDDNNRYYGFSVRCFAS